MQSGSTQQPGYFMYLLLGCCCFYLGFEIFYNYYATLSVDEFWYAHNTYMFKDQLPYRDFAPYKTVLGYYLLLLPLLAKSGILAPLILVKNSLAILNTLILFATSWWLTRYFSRICVLASLAIIVTSEVMLAYSTNFRVDLLGYWFGFAALIFLIENRFVAAGILMGLGFATSQKVLWYIAASNGALGLYWLLYERNWLSIRNLLTYNGVLALVICAYLGFWSVMTDFHSVMSSVFYDAAIMYKLDWYDSARMFFWKILTLHNPLLFFLWPLTILSVCVSYQNDHAFKQRFLIVIFSSIIFLCLVPYKQVFPYYLQVAIPALFVLYAAFFSWLCGIFSHPNELKTLVPKSVMYLFLGLYIAAVIWFSVVFQLPPPYLLISLVPMLLGVYIVNCKSMTVPIRALLFNIVCIAIVIVDVIFPLMLFCMKMVDLNGSYQKQNLAIIDSLLQDGSDYLAGIELVYNKTQPIAGMRHLMGPALDYLHTPTPKLREVMLSSLNLDPNVSTDSVLAALTNANIKFYVNNYRMMELPEKIKKFLDEDYEHLWGSLYLYAPRVRQAQKQVNIKFAGKYQLESRHGKAISIDGKTYAPNTTLYLVKGTHRSEADHNYRLKLMPTGLPYVNNLNYQTDRWEKMLS